MAYTHTGTRPVTLRADPIDPDSTEWVYFSYGTWLRDGETIVSHEAVITGGTVETESTYIGTMTDDEGTDHAHVYGVQFSVEAGASSVSVTHRVSTETQDSPSIGRIGVDRTAIIPVREL